MAAGKIEAGTYTRLACARQLKDMRRRGFGYVFDAQEAERAIAVIQMMPHTKGRWASARELIVLQPWQLFVVAAIFGWVCKQTGLRRYREAYIAVPRKNGKSILAAAIGLLMFAFDGEAGAEVYCGATTERQAWEVFRPAQQMLKRLPDLREEFGIEVMARSLSIASDGARFEPVVGDPGDGSSPSCAIIDEYHEHRNTTLLDTMATGMGARESALLLVVTTAGVMHGGPCYMHQRDVEKMLDGVIQNEQLFGIIYHAESDDDWSDPAVLRKANPNFGISVSEDWLLAQQAQAKQSPSKQNRFRTKHLNQWVSAHTAYFNMLRWSRCADAPPLDEWDGESCVFALDLSSRCDFTVLMRVFQNTVNGKPHYYAYPRFFLPEDVIEEDRTGNYQRWWNAGLLEATDGNEIDFGYIEDVARAEMARFNVLECAYDPWRATQLAQGLAADGALMVEYRNTVQRMSEPMKELEAAVMGRRFHFDGNEILTWMASNTVAKTDANSNVFPRKEANENKIDGIVALIMGIGRTMYSDTNDIGSWLSNPITA